MRRVLERGGHRARAAGRVEHRRGQVAAVSAFKASRAFSFAPLIVCDAERAAAKLQPGVVDVEHDQPRPGRDDELHDRQSDRPRADHQDDFILLDARPLDGVRADAEGFDERQLVERERGRRVQLAGGQDEFLAHPAVGVDAEHLDGRAAVRLAAPAGDALLTVDVRFDRAEVARP